MDYQVIERNDQKYIQLNREGNPIQAERDALDLLSVCAEYGTNLLLIPGERLSDEFLRLSTGIAGAVLQKFAQYGVKAAVLLDQDNVTGRFRDLLVESNRGNAFRTYTDLSKAEAWLTGGD
ncbi:MAG TPA: DUF4180 domain-containing protein [Bacillota bacterium]|nr:DUF4180 domain-containing protein [Bacillota bacterium]